MSDHNIGSYTRQFHKTKKCYGHVFRFKKEQRDRTRLENIVAKTNVQSETCSTYGVNQQDDNTQTSNQDIRSVSSGRRIQSNSNSYLSHASRIENDEQMMSLLRRETRIRRRRQQMIAARIREEEERRVQEALENRKKHTQKANRLRQQKTLPREKRGRVRFADELGYDVILGIEGNGDRKQERQSRLLESLDLQSSVQNSTQFFKMAEKLAETDEHLSTLENRLREIPNGSDSGVSNTNRVRQHDRPISPGTQAALDAIENQEVELGNRDFSSAEDIPPSSSSSESNVKRGASNDSSNPASNGYHNGDVHRNLKGTRLSPLKCELRQAKGQQRKTITRIPPVRIDYNFKVIKQAVVPNSNLTSTDDTESADNTSIAVRSEPPRLRSIKHRKRPWREYVNLPKRQMQPSSKLSLEIMRVEASLARIDNNLMEKKQNIMEIDARSEVSRNISEPCSANSIEDVHAQSLYSNPDSKIPRPRIWGLERRIEATQTRGHLNPITYGRLRQHNEIMEQRNTTPVVRDDRNHDNIFDSVSDLDIPEMSFQRNKEQRQPWSLHSSRQSIQSMASIVKNIQIAPQVQPQQLPPVNEMTSIPLRRPNVLSTQEMAKPSNHRTMPIGRPVQALVPRNQDGGRIHIPDRHMYQILFGP